MQNEYFSGAFGFKNDNDDKNTGRKSRGLGILASSRINDN